MFPSVPYYLISRYMKKRACPGTTATTRQILLNAYVGTQVCHAYVVLMCTLYQHVSFQVMHHCQKTIRYSAMDTRAVVNDSVIYMFNLFREEETGAVTGSYVFLYVEKTRGKMMVCRILDTKPLSYDDVDFGQVGVHHYLGQTQERATINADDVCGKATICQNVICSIPINVLRE